MVYILQNSSSYNKRSCKRAETRWQRSGGAVVVRWRRGDGAVAALCARTLMVPVLVVHAKHFRQPNWNHQTICQAWRL